MEGSRHGRQWLWLTAGVTCSWLMLAAAHSLRAFQFLVEGKSKGESISSSTWLSQVQHDSGLTQARRNTQQWNENIKLELQHLAAATPAGTSLVAIQRHVAVTLATWDAVWGEHLHPKWAEQRMRLYSAQEKVLERYFKTRWGTRKQLVVFFSNAGIGTRGGWGSKAVLQACHKVVERPNSGRPAGRLPGKVVTVDEFRTSRAAPAKGKEYPALGFKKLRDRAPEAQPQPQPQQPVAK
ncbi:hypothetical protein QJQ45_028067 [Haematococcus lacustris]|nr:hypothetical protein QJQ45_028067 [Haematococcus lacustris]